LGEHDEVDSLLSSVYLAYHRDVFWWEIIDTINKLFLSSLLVFFSVDWRVSPCCCFAGVCDIIISLGFSYLTDVSWVSMDRHVRRAAAVQESLCWKVENRALYFAALLCFNLASLLSRKDDMLQLAVQMALWLMLYSGLIL
jgi:hypothetical protein